MHRRFLIPLAFLVLACGGSGDGSLRLIVEDPGATFDRAAVFGTEEVFAWDLRRGAEAALWRSTGQASTAEPTARGLQVVPSRQRLQVDRRVRFEAAEVDSIEVLVDGLDHGNLELRWAPPRERFTPTHSIKLQARDAAGSDHRSFRFAVGKDPGWKGEIGRLRLRGRVTAARPLVMERVVGRRVRELPASLRRAAARPWKVDLGHELRNAVLAVGPRDWRIDVPPRSTLRFAYGLEEGAAGAVAFRVRAELGGGRSAVLFRAELDPGRGEAGRWYDGGADLSSFAGRRLWLRLEAETPGTGALPLSLAVWGNPEVVPPPRERPTGSLVLISVDTLRADRLSLYGHGRPTSPNLDRWAAGGVTFDHTVVQAPWTLPSHVSMLTGLDALRHGVNHNQVIPPGLTLLAEILRARGYATGAVTGGGFLHPRWGFAQGFDSYRYWPQEAPKEEELADGVARAEAWIAGHAERPFFLFFHTYETHGPYRPRQPFLTDLCGAETAARSAVVSLVIPDPDLTAGFRAGPQQPTREVWDEEGRSERIPIDDPELVGCIYDSTVAYADEHLGRLLAALDSLPANQRPTVVVTSDHGEGMGEEGRWGHGYLNDGDLLVPLVIRFADGRGAGRRIADQVRSIDVLPTLLGAAGIPPPAGIDGVSLLPLVAGSGGTAPPAAWSYAASFNLGLSLREANRTKYVFNDTAWPPANGAEALYDLAVDPLETKDLAGGDEAVAGLRHRAREALEKRAAGLRVRFENRGDRPFGGTVEGAAVKATSVKSADLGCPCVQWRGEGALSFTVPPGQAFTLRFEEAAAGSLGLAGGFGEAPDRVAPFREEVELEDLVGLRVLSFDGDGWRWSAGEDARKGQALISLWRIGGPAGASQTLEEDPELARQLRALGYLN